MKCVLMQGSTISIMHPGFHYLHHLLHCFGLKRWLDAKWTDSSPVLAWPPRASSASGPA